MLNKSATLVLILLTKFESNTLQIEMNSIQTNTFAIINSESNYPVLNKYILVEVYNIKYDDKIQLRIVYARG